MLICVTKASFFSLLTYIPVHGWTTVYSPIYWVMGYLGSFQVRAIRKLLWTFSYMPFVDVMSSFLLLSHMVDLNLKGQN